MTKYYRLGNLVFNISGNDIAVPDIDNELSPITCTGSADTSLEFRFEPIDAAPTGAIVASPVITTEDELFYSGNSFRTRLRKEKEILIVSLESRPISIKRKMLPHVARFVHWNYLSPAEDLAKNFMYDTFDYITQLVNVRIKQSYFHASSFEKDGQGVAIVAWSGIGKTTAMLKLVAEDGWNFLSDDLGIIDEQGMLFRSPKNLQIYGYNLKGQPSLREALFRDRALADRLSWHYNKWRRGIAGVRRRVPAEQLFGGTRIGKSAKLRRVFFIERAHVDHIISSPLAISELARRASCCVMKEIEPYHQIVSALYSVQASSGVVPSYNELLTNTRSILEKAFAETNPELVKLPMATSPDELADYLRIRLKSPYLP